MEQAIISGVAHDRSEAKITVVGVPDKPGEAAADLRGARRRARQPRHDRAERLRGATSRPTSPSPSRATDGTTAKTALARNEEAVGVDSLLSTTTSARSA